MKPQSLCFLLLSFFLSAAGPLLGEAVTGEEKESETKKEFALTRDQELAVQRLIYELKNEYEARQKAADKLAAFGKPVVPYILPELKTNDAIIHMGVAEVVRKVGTPAQVDALLTILVRDEKGRKQTKTDVRLMVADILLERGTDAAKKAVLGTLDDPDLYFRKELIKILGKHRMKEALPRITAIAKDSETDIKTLLSICRSLSRYQTPEAARLLAGFLDHEDVYIRRLTLKLLASCKFGGKHAKSIAKRLGSKENKEVEDACRACGTLKITRGLPALVHIAKNSKRPYFVRWEALDAIQKIGNRDIISELRDIEGSEALEKKAALVIRKLREWKTSGR